jgi:hypothetical protein
MWRKRTRIATYALVPVAVIKTFNMRRSVNFICPTIVEGEITPAAVIAAPNTAPAAAEARGFADMLVKNLKV